MFTKGAIHTQKRALNKLRGAVWMCDNLSQFLLLQKTIHFSPSKDPFLLLLLVTAQCHNLIKIPYFLWLTG